MEVAEFLTLEEAARTLKMHPVTVRRHMRSGKLPGRKIGGEWRIGRGALEEFIRGDQKPAPAKIPAKVETGVANVKRKKPAKRAE